MDKVLKLGLPAGSLQEATADLFRKAGYKITFHTPQLLSRHRRSRDPLHAHPRQEMARYVRDGSLDCGLTGYDWIVENNAQGAVTELAELVFSKVSRRPVRWVLAVPNDSPVQEPKDLQGKRIATEVVNITRNWLASHGVTAQVEFSWGATEVKPPRLADAIVEVTETGSRACAPTTSASSAISSRARRASSPTPRPRPTRGSARRWTTSSSCSRARWPRRARSGLMMNVRKADVEKVLGVLPALQNADRIAAGGPRVDGAEHDHRRGHGPPHHPAAEGGRRLRHRRVPAEQDHRLIPDLRTGSDVPPGRVLRVRQAVPGARVGDRHPDRLPLVPRDRARAAGRGQPAGQPLSPPPEPLSLDEEPPSPPQSRRGRWLLLLLLVAIVATLATIGVLRRKEGYLTGREWRPFTPPDNSCTVQLLGRAMEDAAAPESGQRRYVSEGWYSGTTTWLGWRNLTAVEAQIAAAPEAWHNPQLTKLFDQERDWLIGRFGGYVTKDATINFKDPLTREVRLELPDGRGRAVGRMIVHADRPAPAPVLPRHRRQATRPRRRSGEAPLRLVPRDRLTRRPLLPSRIVSCLLARGVELPVDRLEAVAIDVGVVLRRLDRGVAEQFLHGAQVRAAASMCVAKLCRSVCGLTVCGSPARLQYFFTSAHSKIRVNGRPDLLTNKRSRSSESYVATRKTLVPSLLTPDSDSPTLTPTCDRSARYARMAAMAGLPSGTTRCLLPLPKHRQNAGIEVQVLELEPDHLGCPAAGGIERFEQRPVAQIEAVAASGALSSSSTAVGDSTCGMRSHNFGEPSRSTAAASARSSIRRKR